MAEIKKKIICEIACNQLEVEQLRKNIQIEKVETPFQEGREESLDDALGILKIVTLENRLSP